MFFFTISTNRKILALTLCMNELVIALFESPIAREGAITVKHSAFVTQGSRGVLKSFKKSYI